MRIEIRNRCSDFTGFRAQYVKSIFNSPSGCNFSLDVDIPIEGTDWQIGAIVGPSGSGKTSIGRKLFDPCALYEPVGWPTDLPVIEAVAPALEAKEVAGAFSSVGLGDSPAWLRPYHVLSNGERFRADLARLVVERPARVVIDEFTSVVDRQIAKVGASAFAKAWRRGPGQVVLLSCHYDILDWLEPDWVFDTATGKHTGRGLHRRPRIDVELWQTDWRYWPLFEPHHYLKVPKMIGAICYVATVEGEPVAHLGVGTVNVGKSGVEARACRMVVMPEWQGAGVGMRFLNAVCQLQLDGKGRMPGRQLTTMFHTSHPGLCAALRRDAKWAQVSAVLHGTNKIRSRKTLSIARHRAGHTAGMMAGYGGHFRAVQGFRYLGPEHAAKKKGAPT